MYFKILLVQIFFIGVAMCNLQALNATESTDSITNETVTVTSEIPSTASTLKDKVQLTVYYETLCRHCIEFFVDKLKPAVLKLGSHLDITLVPYGNAQTNDDNGKYSFNCQHGERECLGNMVNACIIDSLQNATLATLLSSCLMDMRSYYSNTDITLCGMHKQNLVTLANITKIINCIDGPLGWSLLKSHGEVSQANGVTYVPHLTFDGSAERENDGRDDLVETVCDMLNPKPVECTEYTYK